jgi:hypothetical protein
MAALAPLDHTLGQPIFIGNDLDAMRTAVCQNPERKRAPYVWR